jgi:predicted RNase H-like HicB family nuclease
MEKNIMSYLVIFEQIIDGSMPPGYYYAHIPAVGLTTHGMGIEGARRAAEDLVQLWIAEKTANNEKIQNPEILVSTLELSDAV